MDLRIFLEARSKKKKKGKSLRLIHLKSQFITEGGKTTRLGFNEMWDYSSLLFNFSFSQKVYIENSYFYWLSYEEADLSPDNSTLKEGDCVWILDQSDNLTCGRQWTNAFWMKGKINRPTLISQSLADHFKYIWIWSTHKWVACLSKSPHLIMNTGSVHSPLLTAFSSTPHSSVYSCLHPSVTNYFTWDICISYVIFAYHINLKLSGLIK